MKIVKPSVEILQITPNALRLIEKAGRTCYKSEDKITEDSAEKFVAMLIRRGHESVLEHAGATLKFVCDRGVMAELTRHRLASFSVESTRYCKYENGFTVVDPWFLNILDKIDDETIEKHHDAFMESGPIPQIKELEDRLSNIDMAWIRHMWDCEQLYIWMLHKDVSPQEARAILPNSLKTEVVTTANLREWKHIFKLRCAHAAHPDMRRLMLMALAKMRGAVPVVFDDLYNQYRMEV